MAWYSNLQCEGCEHWHRTPTDPNAIGQVRGECREGPPGITVLPTGGTTIKACAFPLIGPDHPACSRWKEWVDPAGVTPIVPPV